MAKRGRKEEALFSSTGGIKIEHKGEEIPKYSDNSSIHLPHQQQLLSDDELRIPGFSGNSKVFIVEFCK